MKQLERQLMFLGNAPGEVWGDNSDALCPCGEWQSIETAVPATGQPVVLWGALWRQPFVGIVLPEAMGTNCYLDGKDGNGMHARATHWLPIPDVPDLSASVGSMPPEK